MILEAQSPADSLSAEGLLSGSQMAVFSLGPHMAGWMGTLWGLFCKGTSPTNESATSRLNQLPKAPSPNTITVEVRFQLTDLVNNLEETVWLTPLYFVCKSKTEGLLRYASAFSENTPPRILIDIVPAEWGKKQLHVLKNEKNTVSKVHGEHTNQL